MGNTAYQCHILMDCYITYPTPKGPCTTVVANTAGQKPALSGWYMANTAGLWHALIYRYMAETAGCQHQTRPQTVQVPPAVSGPAKGLPLYRNSAQVGTRVAIVFCILYKGLR